MAARKSWTGAAFQEHRTGAACAETLRCMIEARAPLDLIAVASRFPLDEMVHVELCARMAMELGGGTEILHDPDEMILRANPDLSPLLRAVPSWWSTTSAWARRSPFRSSAAPGRRRCIRCRAPSWGAS
jgi:hypothetical protein